MCPSRVVGVGSDEMILRNSRDGRHFELAKYYRSDISLMKLTPASVLLASLTCKRRSVHPAFLQN